MASAYQTDHAYEAIRGRLLTLEIRPLDRLKEEEWATKIHVGRLPVREALTRLHGEGLVTRGEKGGFFAAAMAQDDLHEIRELREILEVEALRLAGKRMSPAQLQELETACDDFSYMVEKGYDTGAGEADRRFHRLLVAASGNSRLVRAYDRSHIPLFQVRFGRSREYATDLIRTELEHREITEALKRGDVEQAIVLLKLHLAHGENVPSNGAPAG